MIKDINKLEENETIEFYFDCGAWFAEVGNHINGEYKTIKSDYFTHLEDAIKDVIKKSS